jgi:uncharacterized damage-inducible protein DinB
VNSKEASRNEEQWRMAESTCTSLAPFYEGWSTYQQHLVTSVAPLSLEQLALRSAPTLRSIGNLAAHIIAGRVAWFHLNMGEGDAAIRPLVAWDDVDPVQQEATDLVRGLEVTWKVVHDCLVRWTPDNLEEMFPSRWYGEQSRRWIIWHVLEHDLHHGGELFLTCGMHGLPVPDL